MLIETVLPPAEDSSASALGNALTSNRGPRPRVLAAIASFGTRNIGYLQRMIQNYRALPFPVDVVVLSEAPKDLPVGVKIAIGLPSANPWSLPFAHKPLFAENIDNYDLFIYSEDDIGVSEANIRAFLAAGSVLHDDEIAGFLRYEKDSSGTIWMPDAHSMFRWDPQSVVERGGQVFAQYSNEHAAFYVMTQAQLRRAVTSGGFLREPYEAKYDMLCAAATDPYTSCGMRKLVSLTDLPGFLIHHMSDRYAGQMGLPLSAFREQVDTLHEIRRGLRPAATLCDVETKIARGEWSKGLYEPPLDAVLDLVPSDARTVLSVGCGWGATEGQLVKRGLRVTALPLDSVIGAVAEKCGVHLVMGNLQQAFERLGGEAFDCVLISNLLHLRRDPSRLFEQCLEFVGPAGSIIVDSPNFQQWSVLINRVRRRRDFEKLRSFQESGVSPFRPGELRRWSRRSGLRPDAFRWYEVAQPNGRPRRRLPLPSARLKADGWVLRATRRGRR